jgi:peptide/nickel transport system ATP-binding protein
VSEPGTSSREHATASLTTPLLEVEDLTVHFPITRGIVLRREVGTVRAVDGVTLSLDEHQTLGLVGESGSGKTTLGRAIVGLHRPTSGTIRFRGRELTDDVRERERGQLQMVFQDPVASLDPRWAIARSVEEPLRLSGVRDRAERRRRVTELLDVVGLPARFARRYPHELSGGQRQRVGVARALALHPAVVVADEAVSALDVSVQGQVVALLQQLKRETGTAILFISHNLEVVQQLCDRVLVLYLGRMMEQGTTARLYDDPAHPYTRALLDAVPIPDPDLQPARLTGILSGELPSPLAPPSGCVFHTRCPYVRPICREQVPPRELAGPDREVACHRWRELALRATPLVPSPAPA